MKLNTGDQVICPKCNKEGELRIYPRATWNYIVHEMKGAFVEKGCMLDKFKYPTGKVLKIVNKFNLKQPGQN